MVSIDLALNSLISAGLCTVLSLQPSDETVWPQRRLNDRHRLGHLGTFRAAATIGFAHAGVRLRSFGSRIFRPSIDSTSTGLGVWPAAGSASALLSNIRTARRTSRRSIRLRRL